VINDWGRKGGGKGALFAASGVGEEILPIPRLRGGGGGGEESNSNLPTRRKRKCFSLQFLSLPPRKKEGADCFIYFVLRN